MVFWALTLPLFFLLSRTWAYPGFSSHGGSPKLVGVPDVGDYEKLVYPNYELQDGGSISHADLTKIIRVSDKAIIKQPQPYPVHVPYKVPYPVEVPKHIPVPVPHYIKVPHPVPVEVVKKVPVPIEVPKPYPVPQNEHQSGGQGGDWAPSSFSGGYNGNYQLAQNDNDQYSNNDYSAGQYQGTSGIGSAELDHGVADNSAAYPAVAQQEENLSSSEDAQANEEGDDHQQ